MKINKYHLFGVFLPLIMFILIALTDLNFLKFELFLADIARFRESVFVVILILIIWGLSRSRWIRNRTFIQKLVFSGLSIVMLTAILTLANRVSFSGLSGNVKISEKDIVLFAVLVGAAFLGCMTLIMLKQLIFINQGKKTEINFRLLLIFLFLHFVYILFGRDSYPSVSSDFGLFFDLSFMKNIFFYLFIIMAFINGFRCKWIHYLNKKQKVGFFVFFALIYPAAQYMTTQTPGSVAEMSTIVGQFFHSLSIFYLIYSGMALLGILLLLPSAGILDRRLNEIRSLQTLSSTIGSVFEKGELIGKSVELSRKVVNADFTWIELKNNSTYKLEGAHGISVNEIEKIPESVRKQIYKLVKDEKGPVLINNLPKKRETRDFRRWRHKAGSLLATMMRFKNKELGILCAIKKEMFGFTEDSRPLFQSFADQVSVALENSNLFQTTIEQKVYREELQMAHDAQMRILPRQMPEVEGVELGAYCMTANEIGGDFYDLIKVDDDRLDIVIGDVSGKGASAAFYMAELKGVIQALAPHFSSPKKILMEINGFAKNHFEPDTFVTMVYAILYPLKRKVHIVRAGHPPVALIRDDRIEWIETDGIGLGLVSNKFLNSSLRQKMIQLKKNDTVFFYTDGLIEARNSEGDEFGESKLEKVLIDLYGENPKSIIKKITARLSRYTRGVSRHDDVTFLTFKVIK